MQQPMTQQHDQMGGQQAITQQMVLCPVRFVYETQILVQPGDHIQPNQTFFINAQNPPPWMQNSLQTRQALTNPAVVYVQHLPNNIVSTVQQPMDQNQLYLQQNFGNFQLQQQMLAQNQDMRPTMQIANIVPNMVQNVQTNVANDRNHQNSQMQANAQIVPVQMNRPVQNQMNQVEVQRQVLMRPQIHQQNQQRPLISMNQVQNMQQQTMAVQNPAQNMNQIIPNIGRPTTNMNIIRTPIPNNVVSVQPIPKVREAAPTELNKSANSPLSNVVPNIRNFVPNYYRPIQPRPQTAQNVMPKVQQHIPVQTVQTTPVYNHDRNNTHQNTNNNYAIMQQLNNPVNRKRKSESPDDTQRKMAPNTMKHTQHQQSMTITKIVNEIGTNTSPVHKPKVNTQFVINNTQLNSNADAIITNLIKEAMLPEKEKLIRNTVYTQARGRVLQDKIEEIKPQIENRPETVNVLENRVMEQVKMDVDNDTKVMEVNESVDNTSINNNTVTQTKQIAVNEGKPRVLEENKENSTEINALTMKPEDSKELPKDLDQTNHIEIVLNYTKPAETDVQLNKDKIVEKKENVNNDSQPNDNHVNDKEETKFKDENIEEKRPIKQENINILTHVLDGYVIQESNFAFPIRKPLKEKTIHANLKKEENAEKDLIRESIKEELKNNVDIPLLPFHYLLLDNSKEETTEESKIIEDTKKDDPFAALQHSTVKDWTVNDVCNHLLKFDWKETVSLFHEHEIDGESLLLVSKQQLLTIGVKEDHADIICEFLKS